jgi:hypothetical protein
MSRPNLPGAVAASDHAVRGVTTSAPSGCAITGDTAARTAAALLAVDPPEIAAVQEAVDYAGIAGHVIVHLDLDVVEELLATVGYLRGQRDQLRAALVAEAARHAGVHWCCDHGACDVHERGDCGARRRILASTRPPGGEG